MSHKSSKHHGPWSAPHLVSVLPLLYLSFNFALREHPQNQCLCRPQRKECSIREKKAIFRRLLAFPVPKNGMPPNFTKKTFTNSHKPRNLRKFPPIRYIALCDMYILGNLQNNMQILVVSTLSLSGILALAVVCLGCKSSYRHEGSCLKAL